MTNKIARLSALAAILLCSYTAIANAADGFATFGTQWWDQTAPEAKYQTYKDIPHGLFLESFWLSDTLCNTQMSLYGRNSFLKDQATNLMLAQGAHLRLDASYAGTPHLYSEVAHTPFTEISPGVFVLPDFVQSAGQKASNATYISLMKDLLGSTPAQDVAMQTDVTKLRLRARPAMGWTFELKGSDNQRDGHMPGATPFGMSNTIEQAVPINQRMVDAEGIATYHKNDFRAQASVGMSSFHNEISSLVFDNPKSNRDTLNASRIGQMSTAPDNKALRGGLDLAYRLPQQKTTITASVAYSRGTQDAAFLPQTVNTVLAAKDSAQLALGRSSLAGEATHLMLDSKITTRLMPDVSVTLRFHQHEYKDKTDTLNFIGHVVMDQTYSADTSTTDIWGSKQTVLGGDLDLTPVKGVSVNATYEHHADDHTNREVLSDAENVFGVKARVLANDMLSLNGSFKYARRTADPADTAGLRADGEQPLLSRFDVASRKQTTANGGAVLSLTDQVDLSLQYQYAKNDYDSSAYGLQLSKDNAFIFEVDYRPLEVLDMELGGSLGTMTTSQHTGPVRPTVDSLSYLMGVDDKNSSVFAEVEWKAIPKQLTLTANYNFSRDMADYSIAWDNTYANRVALLNPPSTFYRHQTFTLQARYQLRASTDVTLRYVLDQLDVNDWALQGLSPLQLSTSATGVVSAPGLWLGNNLQSYTAHQVALVATRHF